MKKIFIIFIALTLILSLYACGTSTGNNDDKTPIDQTNDNQNNENTQNENRQEENTQDGNTQNKNTDVTIAEQVVYDENDFKITVTGFSNNSLFGPEVMVLIENNSSKNITIQARNSSVNGFMIETIFSADVAAGKKANDAITFSSSDLELVGITTIKDIEFSLHVIDADSFDDIVETDIIVLTTSADPSFVQEFDASGFMAYDANDIKVVVQKLNSSNSFWGSDVYLYIENNSDNDITVQARDVSLNGFMVEPFFSCDIMAGKKAIDTMTFMESDLTNNGITDITDLELKLHIFDSQSLNTIIESDTIKVTFE